MKKYVLEFVRRGLPAAGIGPIVLAIVYMVLQKTGTVTSLSVNQVCIGIFSITALAFIAGGMNVVYQMERLPLMVAIFLHGAVLYISYLVTYLLNNWLDAGAAPIIVFSVVFVVGYIIIWAVIYSIIKKNTDRLNIKLMRQQKKESTP